MNRNKAHLARHDLAKATCGKDAQDAILDFIDAILEEPSDDGHPVVPRETTVAGRWRLVPEPWPGEIAEARLKAELQTMTADRDSWRTAFRSRDDRMEFLTTHNRDLTAQVEGLTSERDAARVGLQNKIEECKKLNDALDVALSVDKARRAVMEALQTDNRTLNTECDRLTAERDALKARIEGAEERWFFVDGSGNVGQWAERKSGGHNYCHRYRLVPDPLPPRARPATGGGAAVTENIRFEVVNKSTWSSVCYSTGGPLRAIGATNRQADGTWETVFEFHERYPLKRVIEPSRDQAVGRIVQETMFRLIRGGAGD